MRQVIEKIREISERLRHCRRGGVAVFLAFAIIPAIGFIGIGTDIARAHLVKSRLSSALDAAALAVAKKARPKELTASASAVGAARRCSLQLPPPSEWPPGQG